MRQERTNISLKMQSELKIHFGKAAIDKKSSGETRGRQGSSSRNIDALGREIMTPDEVRKMDNRKCLVFVRGFDPILDDKYFTHFLPYAAHGIYQRAENGGHAGIGGKSAKGGHTVLFLLGNFGHADAGASWEVWAGIGYCR